MELKITMDDLLKDMKEYTDIMEYLNFFYKFVQEVYDIDPNEDFGINQAYEEKFNKPTPKVPC